MDNVVTGLRKDDASQDRQGVHTLQDRIILSSISALHIASSGDGVI